MTEKMFKLCFQRFIAKPFIFFLIIQLAILISGCLQYPQGGYSSNVVYVYDGDTIKLANGEKVVIGYNETFGKERPARIESVTSTSGKLIGDGNDNIVTILSTSDKLALFITADIVIV